MISVFIQNLCLYLCHVVIAFNKENNTFMPFGFSTGLWFLYNLNCYSNLYSGRADNPDLGPLQVGADQPRPRGPLLGVWPALRLQPGPGDYWDLRRACRHLLHLSCYFSGFYENDLNYYLKSFTQGQVLVSYKDFKPK